MLKALLISGVVAVFTAAPQGSQAANQEALHGPHQEQTSIVGSWLGTFVDNGERILMSFTSDGLVLSSVQTEVSLTNPVLTPGHGVWTQVGRRQFAFTDVTIFYDIQTGEDRGVGKLRGLLTLDKAGNLSGDNKVEIFDPNGNLVTTVPHHPLRLTRITVEPLE
jgi:hypothetical protein